VPRINQSPDAFTHRPNHQMAKSARGFSTAC
jgi:hypothetical protein